jgi:hypothetical protein
VNQTAPRDGEGNAHAKAEVSGVMAIEPAASLFRVRAAMLEDRPFIGAHWTRAQQALERGQRGSLSQAAGDTWPKMAHRVVERILGRPGTICRIACSPVDSTVLFGFAAWSGDHLHFVFVRPELRKAGVCTALLEGCPELTSCSVQWKAALAYHPERSW